MAKKKNLISQEWYEKILAELSNIKEIQLPETLEVLKEARSQGDLSENADYHSAKEKISMLNRRVAELESMIENIEIMEDSKKETASKKVVGYGSTVSLNIEGDKDFSVEVVWSWEVEIDENVLKISLDSPLGKAIDGKKKWDVVTMKLVTGDKKVSILSVD